MARLPKSEVEKREQKMLEIMSANPEWSVAKANDAYSKLFDSKMRVTRAYELQKIARDKSGSDSKLIEADEAENHTAEEPRRRAGRPKWTEEQKAAASARRGKAPKASPPQRAEPKASPPPRREMPSIATRTIQSATPSAGTEALMLLQGTPEQLQWFQKSLQGLNSGGLTNLEIEHMGDTYALVKQAS